MSKQKQVLARRHEISKCLSKSITLPSAISDQTGIPVDTVKNDLKWMKKNSEVWLKGHALNGYVFETQQTIEQLKDIELELQALRQSETNLHNKLRVIDRLTMVINMRWVIQGDGPTLMAQRFVDKNATS